jgi:hypothetical protein
MRHGFVGRPDDVIGGGSIKAADFSLPALTSTKPFSFRRVLRGGPGRDIKNEKNSIADACGKGLDAQQARCAEAARLGGD